MVSTFVTGTKNTEGRSGMKLKVIERLEVDDVQPAGKKRKKSSGDVAEDRRSRVEVGSNVAVHKTPPSRKRSKSHSGKIRSMNIEITLTSFSYAHHVLNK